MVGIPAIGDSFLVLLHGVVGAGEAVLAILFEMVLAGGRRCLQESTMQPTPTDIADLEFFDLGADGSDMADDFVPGNHGEHAAAPFVARLVDIRMADAAIINGDGDIVRARRPAFQASKVSGGFWRPLRRRLWRWSWAILLFELPSVT